jgi:hypothetical protein
MINSYCDPLKDTFAQWVYFGIIDEEDAQCFSVRSSIEGGSFILAAGAVLLALINTFVNKAVVQYFRDKNELERQAIYDEEESGNLEGRPNYEEEDVSDDDVMTRIHPIPVLFSDTFRWLLRRDGSVAASSRDIMSDSYGGLGLQKGTTNSIRDETSEGRQLFDEDSSSNSKSDTEEVSRTSFVRGSSFSATTFAADFSAIDGQELADRCIGEQNQAVAGEQYGATSVNESSGHGAETMEDFEET